MTKPLIGPSIMPALWVPVNLEFYSGVTNRVNRELVRECFVPLASLFNGTSWDLDSVLGGLE